MKQYQEDGCQADGAKTPERSPEKTGKILYKVYTLYYYRWISDFKRPDHLLTELAHCDPDSDINLFTAMFDVFLAKLILFEFEQVSMMEFR